MKIQWTSKASSDLVRLHEHLSPVAPEAAARVVQQLAHAPDRLLDYPRIGEKLEAYEPFDGVASLPEWWSGQGQSLCGGTHERHRKSSVEMQRCLYCTGTHFRC